MSEIVITEMLRAARASSVDGTEWLGRLPALIRQLCERWQLEVHAPPYDGGMCGWVAPVRRANGSIAVLKVTWPHPEAAAESVALRWWDGDGAIRLLVEDREAWAMLLEPCVPGTQLRDAGKTDDDALMIGLAVAERLWDKAIPSATTPPTPSLQGLCARWADLAKNGARWAASRLPGLRSPWTTTRRVAVRGNERTRSIPVATLPRSTSAAVSRARNRASRSSRASASTTASWNPRSRPVGRPCC
ncbi:MAG: aminoglycoside phosphotransferase family protein [Actinomycetota bacterium]|nr:aminoglycoside phosphotransferase family protein [Actinomycetota bacterium]